MIGKKWVVLVCLLLIGCGGSETVYRSPSGAVVYEIYDKPQVTIDFGRLIYPLSDEGIPLILENVGTVGADVFVRLTTSEIRDETRVLCNTIYDLRLPVLKVGQHYEFIFWLDDCAFPRDSNLNQAMRFNFEVRNTRTNELITSATRIMEEGHANARNPLY